MLKFTKEMLSQHFIRQDFSKKQTKDYAHQLENPGIDPGTSRMQSGRSTI